jgi:hypothetical protein
MVALHKSVFRMNDLVFVLLNGLYIPLVRERMAVWRKKFNTKAFLIVV